MPQSRNYNEVPVQGVCLYFFHIIHKLFQFFNNNNTIHFITHLEITVDKWKDE